MTTCPACGAALAADAPEGLCPACLLLGALAPAASASGAHTEATESSASLPLSNDLAGLFPQLEIQELLGRGGMGIVYKAWQRNLNRPVALKILPPEFAADDAFVRRFEREAQALAGLDHPNVVQIHDLGKAGDLYYFVMEFVDGVNLRQLLQAGRLAPEKALQMVPQICDALEYAHSKGVVHRDIKPENILVSRTGDVKIADFGLVKLVGQPAEETRLTGTQQVMGTLHYMAPEQFDRPQQVDHRADIYALGVVFYEMLTGELPRGRFAPPSQCAAVDARIDPVVLRALEQHPDQRFQRASDVKLAVESLQYPAPVPQQPAPRKSVLPNTPLVIIALGAAVFFVPSLLIATALVVWRTEPACLIPLCWPFSWCALGALLFTWFYCTDNEKKPLDTFAEAVVIMANAWLIIFGALGQFFLVAFAWNWWNVIEHTYHLAGLNPTAGHVSNIRWSFFWSMLIWYAIRNFFPNFRPGLLSPLDLSVSRMVNLSNRGGIKFERWLRIVSVGLTAAGALQLGITVLVITGLITGAVVWSEHIGDLIFTGTGFVIALGVLRSAWMLRKIAIDPTQLKPWTAAATSTGFAINYAGSPLWIGCLIGMPIGTTFSSLTKEASNVFGDRWLPEIEAARVAKPWGRLP